MKALDRKVLRDLRLLWSQALTIALVVASGIGGFVGSLSAVDSLALARDRFYQQGRFADVFASLKRAPASLEARLRTLPGVVDVQTTVQTMARVSVPRSTDPVVGAFIGIDSRRPAHLNLVSLRSGQWPEPGASDGNALQALVSEGFATAHQIRPGAHLTALINGRHRVLRVTGIALSPEYIFAGLWGMPDVRGFGVFWVDQQALAGMTDMAGAFNQVALQLSPQASQTAALEALDRLLVNVGGLPARLRKDQTSHAMLDNEIREQRVLGTLLPSIFLAVAAFLIHVVAARLVATQREQVAALKALGYSNRSIALHYLKLVSPMVLGGYLLGLLLGRWLGSMMTSLYAEFFHFPTFSYRMGNDLILTSLAVVAATAVLGTLTAIAATVRLAPAEAMRPLSPGHYRRSLLERVPWLRTGTALRMILRNIERRPLRAALTTGGIAASVAIVVMGNFFRDAIEVIVDTQFGLALRGDIVVWTTDPMDAGAARAFLRLPGVLQAEAGRNVPVRFVNGARAESGVLQGYAEAPELRRIIDVDLRQATLPPDGLLMTDRLADKLGLRPGDTVTVEVREGRRQIRPVVLQGTVRDMMGLNAFMDIRALNRLLGEGEVASQFTLSVLRSQVQRVLTATQHMPRVGGAFSKASMLRNMQEISARNILIMSTILTGFAAVIAVGVVYNSARITLAERSWELASLRVLGFTRAEVSFLLLGELALGIAVALPVGMFLGWALTHVLVELMRSDQFSFPVVIRPRTYAWSALCVVAAGVASALVVRQRIDRLDMVAALKTRE
jgi:putative ABC transport system permease protein